MDQQRYFEIKGILKRIFWLNNLHRYYLDILKRTGQLNFQQINLHYKEADIIE